MTPLSRHRYLAERGKRAHLARLQRDRTPLFHFSGEPSRPPEPPKWWRREANLLDAIILAGAVVVVLALLAGFPELTK